MQSTQSGVMTVGSRGERFAYYPTTGLTVVLERAGLLPRYRVHVHYGRNFSTVAMATYWWDEAIKRFDDVLTIADEVHGPRSITHGSYRR